MVTCSEWSRTFAARSCSMMPGAFSCRGPAEWCRHEPAADSGTVYDQHARVQHCLLVGFGFELPTKHLLQINNAIALPLKHRQEFAKQTLCIRVIRVTWPPAFSFKAAPGLSVLWWSSVVVGLLIVCHGPLKSLRLLQPRSERQAAPRTSAQLPEGPHSPRCSTSCEVLSSAFRPGAPTVHSGSAQCAEFRPDAE